MLLGEVPHTPQDVHFRLFGIPCRVHPLFWLVAVLFAYPNGGRLPGNLVIALLVSGVACLFVSILVHELGHALLMRWAGFRPEIVLYAMGGYASYGQSFSIRPAVRVAILLAGPGAGFLLYLLVVLIEPVLARSYGGELPIVLKYTFLQLKFINLAWGLVNLLPVFPLDGGQIARTLLQHWWGYAGVRASLLVSIIASGLAILVFIKYWGESPFSFPVILFGLLCFESIQAYQGRPGVRF